MGIFANFLDKFKFEDETIEKKAITNQIEPNRDDASYDIESVSSSVFNFDWTYNCTADLIDNYREISNFQEVDYAIDDIVNEMVSFGEDEDPVEINLDDIDEVSDKIKDTIIERCEHIFNILELRDTIHERARRFYVDGRLAYHKVIDKKSPKQGLLEVVELDPRYVTKLRKIEKDPHDKTIKDIKEVFVYNKNIANKSKDKKSNTTEQYNEVLEIHPDAITYVTSGLTDQCTGLTIGWLHKAVKPANQLRMMENAILIYRITRAPERRIFNVYTKGLTKSKAEQYINNLASKYRNRMSFDPENGSFKDKRHLSSMQEDFWFPTDGKGNGSTVTTLQGGQNLGDLQDLIYFQKNLYKALNVPLSRLESDSMINFGKQSEISRDELKLSKLVSKIRKRFNMMFLDLLKTDLILTNVMTIKEWDQIEQKIRFKYALDLYLEEQKKNELLMQKIELANEVTPYVGKYFSNQYVQQEIFGQSEEEMEEQQKQIDAEKSDPRFKQEEEI